VAFSQHMKPVQLKTPRETRFLNQSIINMGRETCIRTNVLSTKLVFIIL